MLVKCVDGNGCFTREEWETWKPNYRAPNFPTNTPDGGNTLDLNHCCERPGEYWVTKRSYISNIGVEGIHQREGIPREIDFVGE